MPICIRHSGAGDAQTSVQTGRPGGRAISRPACRLIRVNVHPPNVCNHSSNVGGIRQSRKRPGIAGTFCNRANAYGYNSAMRRLDPAMRKFSALFAAAIFMLVAQPAAQAMPAASHHAMTLQGMDTTARGAVPCAHCPRQTDQNPPSKDMAHCQGMLDCSGFVGLTQHAARLLLRGQTTSPARARYSAAPGIIHRPDHPPPIV